VSGPHGQLARQRHPSASGAQTDPAACGRPGTAGAHVTRRASALCDAAGRRPMKGCDGTVRRLLVVVMALLALSACGVAGDTGGAAGATAASPTAASPTAAVDGEPLAISSEASTEMMATPSFPDAAGQRVAFLTAVRTGRHAGFDRVVWTFDGELPAYRVAYVERPITEDGSGAPIEVRGDATLQIILTPASGTDLDGEQVRTVYEGPERIDGTQAGTSVVEEIVLTGDFEATMSWVIGTDRQAAFSVTELSDPTRVVLDIAGGAG
jgi:hypothetical protein